MRSNRVSRRRMPVQVEPDEVIVYRACLLASEQQSDVRQAALESTVQHLARRVGIARCDACDAWADAAAVRNALFLKQYRSVYKRAQAGITQLARAYDVMPQVRAQWRVARLFAAPERSGTPPVASECENAKTEARNEQTLHREICALHSLLAQLKFEEKSLSARLAALNAQTAQQHRRSVHQQSALLQDPERLYLQNSRLLAALIAMLPTTGRDVDFVLALVRRFSSPQDR